MDGNGHAVHPFPVGSTHPDKVPERYFADGLQAEYSCMGLRLSSREGDIAVIRKPSTRTSSVIGLVAPCRGPTNNNVEIRPNMWTRVFVFGALALAMVACTTKRPVQTAEIQKTAPDVVWVTYHNNSTVAVADPLIEGDTLRGVRHQTSTPLVIPMSDVRTVQAKKPDGLKTAVFITGLTAVWASGVYLIWGHQEGPNRTGVYCGTYEKTRDGWPNGAPLVDC